MVSTKYKTVEKKVKPAAGPLPIDSEQKRKEVSGDLTLWKSVDIGHAFTNETRKKLQIGGGGFLLQKEEDRFREMLEQHGKAFAFTSKEIGCVDPKIVEPMVICWPVKGGRTSGKAESDAGCLTTPFCNFAGCL